MTFHTDPARQDTIKEMQAQLLQYWNPVEIEEQVRQSQKERLLIEQSTAGAWRGATLGVPPDEWR